MEGEHVSTSIFEGLYIILGILYHQMAVEKIFGMFSKAFNNRGAHSEIRHKMAIHDIEVEPVRTVFSDDINRFFGKAGKIAAEHRGGNNCFHESVVNGITILWVTFCFLTSKQRTLTIIDKNELAPFMRGT